MMWAYTRRRFTPTFLSVTLGKRFTSECLKPTQSHFICANFNTALNLSALKAARISVRSLRSPGFTIFLSSFTSSIYVSPNGPTVKPGDESNVDDSSENSEDDEVGSIDGQICRNRGLAEDVATILNILRRPESSKSQVKNKLEQFSVTPSSELVVEVLSRVRNDWEAAFTFFLWAGKQPHYSHSLREYHSMISILAKMRKFDTAWCLINEMRQGGTGQSLVTPQTLLIMIRRYCAVHEVGKAINTFYAHKLFKFDIGMEEFHNLLSALCRYKNVKDAEHLLFCNENVFLLNTKSFNIILNGWCNIMCDPREAKRIWRDMDKRVIHALAKGRCVKDARDLLKTMEEYGVAPNAVTYNSLIKPLCTARQVDEAWEVFHEMLQRGLSPTVRTYHAFFRILRSGEEVFALLDKMNKMGCHPTNDTYIMLIRKLCRWRQLDDVLQLWSEISKNGGPDRSSYIALIYGLFLNGKLEEAYKYNEEMKEKQFLPEPKLDETLQTWMSGKQISKLQNIDSKENDLDLIQSSTKSKVTSRKFREETYFPEQSETRSVVRERGFSLLEH